MPRRFLPREHGTERGYRQHVTDRTVPCTGCLNGHAGAEEKRRNRAGARPDSAGRWSRAVVRGRQEPLTPEEQEAALKRAAEFLHDSYEVLTGTGGHAEHERSQVGRCVYCSCGLRVQGGLTRA